MLAASTPGFTGADLANVINEAALLAARRGNKVIGQNELEEGIMRVIAGPEKKSRLFSEKERKITAYHEMGHAIVGFYLEGTDEVHKISIVSRGQALGYTISLPTEDRYLTTKGSLMAQMAMTLGGRAAEELVFNEVTTGAANDIERITATAKSMIMRFGMSEKLGPRVLGRNHDMPFLGRDMGAEPDYSEEIAREIDDEIRRVIEEAHDMATTTLREHMDELHLLSAILIERETVDKDQFERLLAGEAEESVFAEVDAAKEEPAEPEAKDKPAPKPAPRALPGAAMQPPPDPADLAPSPPQRARSGSGFRAREVVGRGGHVSCGDVRARELRAARRPGRPTPSCSSRSAPSTTPVTTTHGRRASPTSTRLLASTTAARTPGRTR